MNRQSKTIEARYNLCTTTDKDVLTVNSGHVEAVVLLSNKNAKSKNYLEIGIDVEDYYKIKDAKNA